jgi:hypothetical protein
LLTWPGGTQGDLFITGCIERGREVEIRMENDRGGK